MTPEYYFIRTKDGVKQLELNNVLVLEASDNHVYFRHKNNIGYELVRLTLSDALEQLPPRQFARINRSFAVALKYVAEARKELIIFKNGLKLEYTHYPKYWKEFLRQLNIVESPKDSKNEEPE